MRRSMVCLALAIGFACILRPIVPARQAEKVAIVCDIKILTGDQLLAAKNFFVAQRLTAFREYPYLYVGTEEGEAKFFDWFTSFRQSAAVVAYVGDEMVGFLTGWPLVGFSEHVMGLKEGFLRERKSMEDHYYIGEAIVLPAHRDKFIGVRMVAALEAHARGLGYKAVCGADERHESHPLKPANYREKGAAARRLGYVKSVITSECEWPTVQPDGSVKMQNHTLTYWFKDLRSVAAPE